MTEIKEQTEYNTQDIQTKQKDKAYGKPKEIPYPLWYMSVHCGDYWVGDNLEIFVRNDSVLIVQEIYKIKYEYTGAMICYKCNYIHPYCPAPHYCPKCDRDWYNYWNKKKVVDPERSSIKTISLNLWEYLLNLQNMMSMRVARRKKRDFENVFPLDCLNPPDDINY